MSSDRDTTRIVRSWLEMGATALPDRVLDAVLDQLPTTPQRRSWGPARRFLDMNTPLRLAGGIAVVAVVAVLGFSLLSRPTGISGPGQSPTSSPTLIPTPTPIPTPIAIPEGGAPTSREAGTYVISINDRPVTFSVPAGWTSDQNFIYKPVEEPAMVLVTFWTVTHIESDVCHADGPLVDVGTTVAELTNALLAQKGRVASPATDVTLGGHPAKRIEMTVPADLDISTCDGEFVKFWPAAGPDESGGLCCVTAGTIDLIYIVDVAGPFMVVARHDPDASAADLAELDAVMASIRIDAPPSPSPSASPAP